MTRVCLVGEAESNLRYELLSRETARRALATYDLAEPWANTVAVETVSLGAAVSLLNDLEWYLVRFVDDAFVFEPSVSETEWLSRDLATAIRDDEVDPEDSGRFLKVYGVVEAGTDVESPPGRPAGQDEPPERDADATDESPGGADENPEAAEENESDGHESEAGGGEGATTEPPELVEPMFVTRTGETLPEYDLRPVDDTLRVRVTESEFGA